MVTVAAPTDTSIAARLAILVTAVIGVQLPVRLRAWDGSEVGPEDAPVLVIHDKTALRRVLWSPNELGLAQAYVAGEIDVEGDVADGLRRLRRHVGENGLARDNGHTGGAFIESYVAPDMHMRPVGETVALLEMAGLEVRDVHAMREHYVRTVAFWLATLERRWAEIVAIVGEPTARVWRLYLVGGVLTFAEGRMGVDQILAVRPTVDGGSGMPAVREYAVGSAGA